jgi:hypothetical protein
MPMELAGRSADAERLLASTPSGGDGVALPNVPADVAPTTPAAGVPSPPAPAPAAASAEVDSATVTIVINAFAFDHSQIAHKEIPLIVKALQELGLSSAARILNWHTSFAIGETLAPDAISSLARAVRAKWPSTSCEWWPESAPCRSDISDCWCIFVLAARRVRQWEEADRQNGSMPGPPGGDDGWKALEEIGLLPAHGHANAPAAVAGTDPSDADASATASAAAVAASTAAAVAASIPAAHADAPSGSKLAHGLVCMKAGMECCLLCPDLNRR